MKTVPIDENFVVDSVATFLEQKGFEIEQKLTTGDRGVDIRAVHREHGQTWLVEAKGQTSSKKNSNRFGKAFDSSQIRVHVAMALYAASALRQIHPDKRMVHIGVALPNDEAHKKKVADIGDVIDLSGVEVFWVSGDGRVKVRRGGV